VNLKPFEAPETETFHDPDWAPITDGWATASMTNDVGMPPEGVVIATRGYRCQAPECGLSWSGRREIPPPPAPHLDWPAR
jgi:hypothetical protein